jgi:hypothetical protein
MISLPQMGRGGWFFLLALALSLGTSCKRSHDEAKKIEIVESQLDLPEMSAEEKKIGDKRLEWNMATLYDAYDKVGSRNKKWDGEAHRALKFFAQARSYGANLKGFPELLDAYVARALELGCNDPMIKYLRVRFETSQSELTPIQIAQAYAIASDGLEASEYGELRKFYAAIRAVNAYLKVKPWPPEGIGYRDRAAFHFYSLLEDKRIPIGEIDDAAHEYLVIVNRWGEKGPYDQMEALLLKNWSKYGVTYLLQGKFYTDHAWKGRGSGYSDTVTPEQWELFFERLDMAEKALMKGMEVDPKEGRLPMQMITVASAQSKGLPEMRHWWEKAMEANPNNYDACDKLLYFLLPKWYGSREMMIEFGRECVASDKFGGTVPLILADVHDTYNRNNGPSDSSYWLEPDVWPDIKLAFERFFELNPKAISWRHNYARYAYWCQQWDALQEQINLMGDEINYSYFGGREEYDEMVRLAAEKGSSEKN